MKAMRWGDNDRYLGPFTFAPGKPYPHWAVMLESASDSDSSNDDKCYLRISTPWFTFATTLPHIIKPHREKRYPDWDYATVERIGRNWYWEIDQRTYGISYSEGFLQVKYGRNGGSSCDSSIEQSWCKHLPWTQWRHIRRSLYDLDGKHFWSEIDSETRAVNKLGGKVPGERWAIIRSWEEMCPKAAFKIQDHDGEEIEATTYIEEREWRFGTGGFKWLSLFRRPKIRRSLDIRFSGETGPEKGSWKGGTIGTSIEMLPGELHEPAFRRYCDEEHRSKYRKYSVKFVGPTNAVDAPNR